MQKSVYDTKDMMLKAIDSPSVAMFIRTSDQILMSLKWTMGLWKEADYAYKASEICERIYQRANDVGGSLCVKNDSELSAMRVKIIGRSLILRKQFDLLQYG